MKGQTKRREQEPQRVAIKQPAISVRFRRPGSSGARMKRLGDLAATCALIAFTLPLMAIVAIAIKCDSTGPVFEREWRVGSAGRGFQARTFRTAWPVAEHAGACHRTP